MPHGVLLDPSNRLLGGATGELSLYGAQPAVKIGPAGPPPSDPTLLTVPSSAPAPPVEAQVPPAASVSLDQTALAAESIPATPPAAMLHAAQPSTFDSQTLAPQVASPTGSGSIAPIVADTAIPVTARTADPDVRTSTPGDASPALTQGLAATSLAAPVLSTTDTLAIPVIALAPAITALTAPALDTAAGAVGHVVSATGTATTDTAALLDGVAVDTAIAAMETTFTTVAAAVPQPIVDTVAATTDTLTTTAADLTAAALPEEPIGGSDPAAGVTTLVSMVETDAVFEVGPSIETPDEAPASESIIDTLASDEAPSALLGDAAGKPLDGLLSKDDDDDGAPGLI